ncbi:MAG: methyltransferase [Mesorhizobium sp.]|nr:MAG: methyltransferase [Mesorhizobium sp.]RWQ41142.1 MAG: methyltransferase [Mesorhizobium sp.]TIL27933.1 MAG: methyltransferase [Mesorhizobium sp.]
MDNRHRQKAHLAARVSTSMQTKWLTMKHDMSNTLADISDVQDVLAMTLGVAKTHVLGVAAELGIADLLKHGPRSVAEIAATTKTNQGALLRLMRVLASLGILEELTPGMFVNTSKGRLLQTGAPRSVRHYAMLMAQECLAASWPCLLHSMRTGESTFEKTNGHGIYEYFRMNPAAGAVMNQAMSEMSSQEGVAICDAYEFAPDLSVVDVGGGRGGLLLSILEAHPGIRGTLLDLPHVATEAQEMLAARVVDRCKIVGGDFLREVPGGGDLYILKRILVDQTDDTAMAVLRNVRTAIAPQGALLIADPGVESLYGRSFDMLMLMIFGGKLRSESDLAALLEKAGFRLTRTMKTAAAIHLVEAVPI